MEIQDSQDDEALILKFLDQRFEGRLKLIETEDEHHINALKNLKFQIEPLEIFGQEWEEKLKQVVASPSIVLSSIEFSPDKSQSIASARDSQKQDFFKVKENEHSKDDQFTPDLLRSNTSPRNGPTLLHRNSSEGSLLMGKTTPREKPAILPSAAIANKKNMDTITEESAKKKDVGRASVGGKKIEEKKDPVNKLTKSLTTMALGKLKKEEDTPKQMTEESKQDEKDDFQPDLKDRRQSMKDLLTSSLKSPTNDAKKDFKDFKKVSKGPIAPADKTDQKKPEEPKKDKPEEQKKDKPATLAKTDLSQSMKILRKPEPKEEEKKTQEKKPEIKKAEKKPEEKKPDDKKKEVQPLKKTGKDDSKKDTKRPDTKRDTHGDKKNEGTKVDGDGDHNTLNTMEDQLEEVEVDPYKGLSEENKKIFESLTNIMGRNVRGKVSDENQLANYINKKISLYENKIEKLAKENEELSQNLNEEEIKKQKFSMKTSTKNVVELVENEWILQIFNKTELTNDILVVLELFLTIDDLHEFPDHDNLKKFVRYAGDYFKGRLDYINDALLEVEDKVDTLSNARRLKLKRLFNKKPSLFLPNSMDGLPFCMILTLIIKDILEYLGIIKIRSVSKKIINNDRVYMLNKQSIEVYNQRLNELKELIKTFNSSTE